MVNLVCVVGVDWMCSCVFIFLGNTSFKNISIISNIRVRKVQSWNVLDKTLPSLGFRLPYCCWPIFFFQNIILGVDALKTFAAESSNSATLCDLLIDACNNTTSLTPLASITPSANASDTDATLAGRVKGTLSTAFVHQLNLLTKKPNWWLPDPQGPIPLISASFQELLLLNK